MTPVSLHDLIDPSTGRMRVRMVDITTEGYEVARKYMIRLEDEDMVEPRLSRMAAHTNLSAADFRAAFAPIAGYAHLARA